MNPEPLPLAPSSDQSLLLVDTPIVGPELRSAISEIRLRRRCAMVTSRAELAEQLATGNYAAVFVVRSWPLADVGVLATLAADSPGVEFVQVLGTWCEGEQRTGEVVPGFRRVFWDAVSSLSFSPARLEGVVVVASRQHETLSAINDALQPLGACAVSLAEWAGQEPVAAVWEGTQLSGREAASLAGLARRLPAGIPLVVLLDFPRAESVAAARELGAIAVLRKPYDRDHLLAVLSRARTAGAVGDRIGHAA